MGFRYNHALAHYKVLLCNGFQNKQLGCVANSQKIAINMKALLNTCFITVIIFTNSLIAQVIVSEDFSGAGDLSGNTTDTFNSAITTAGGSSTWAASNVFNADGSIDSGANDRNAYLDLGSYINDAAGTSTGSFTLSVDFSGPSTDTWVGLSFFDSSVVIADNFVNGGGHGTLIYRNNGDVDGFAGPGTANAPAEDGGTFAGAQTLSIELDLTTAGGYNRTSNFGTITFFAGATNIGSHTYTTAGDFQYIGLTRDNSSVVTLDNFQLAQVPEPSTAMLLAGAFGVLFVLRRTKKGASSQR